MLGLAPQQNVMGKDDGAIPGESESTDGLIDQYRRWARRNVCMCRTLALHKSHDDTAVPSDYLYYNNIL